MEIRQLQSGKTSVSNFTDSEARLIRQQFPTAKRQMVSRKDGSQYEAFVILDPATFVTKTLAAFQPFQLDLMDYDAATTFALENLTTRAYQWFMDMVSQLHREARPNATGHASPVAKQLPALFDGTHTLREIKQQIEARAK